MSDIGQSVVRWAESNLITIAKNALLRNRMVGWGGRFKHGDVVPVGVAVLYIDKVMLAVSDNQAELPTEGARGFELLVDLKHMRIADDPFISKRMQFGKVRSSSQAIASCAARYAEMRIIEKVYNSDIDGTFRWKGIYQGDDTYSRGDLVAYKGFVYRALTGSGVPSVSIGWEQLDGRSRSSGLAINRTYVVDDDGNYVIDDDGNYVVAE